MVTVNCQYEHGSSRGEFQLFFFVVVILVFLCNVMMSRDATPCTIYFIGGNEQNKVGRYAPSNRTQTLSSIFSAVTDAMVKHNELTTPTNMTNE